jgi:CIC family chloride channel protein
MTHSKIYAMRCSTIHDSCKKSLYIYFYNKDFVLTFEIGSFSLNLIPLLICIPSSILVGLLMYFLKLPRWFGPADTIYAAHNRAGTLDLKGGFGSTLASFISISGGASVGIYGPLVHFGANYFCIYKKKFSFIPKIPHDIIIGSGVAAAISAGFGAPLAGIICSRNSFKTFFNEGCNSFSNFIYGRKFSASEIGI